MTKPFYADHLSDADYAQFQADMNKAYIPFPRRDEDMAMFLAELAERTLTTEQGHQLFYTGEGKGGEGDLVNWWKFGRDKARETLTGMIVDARYSKHAFLMAFSLLTDTKPDDLPAPVIKAALERLKSLSETDFAIHESPRFNYAVTLSNAAHLFADMMKKAPMTYSPVEIHLFSQGCFELVTRAILMVPESCGAGAAHYFNEAASDEQIAASAKLLRRMFVANRANFTPGGRTSQWLAEESGISVADQPGLENAYKAVMAAKLPRLAAFIG